MLIWLVCITTASGPIWKPNQLDVTRTEVHALNGIDSPTAALWLDNQLHLGADLLETRPGVYRISPNEKGELWASLVHFLPQQEIEGLNLGPEGRFYAASNRWFTHQREDWKPNLLEIDHNAREQLSRTPFDVDTACGDGQPRCGVISIIPLDSKRIAVFTKRKLARVRLFIKDKDAWKERFNAPIRSMGRYPVVSEVKRFGDRFVFLLKDQRQFAEMPIADLNDTNDKRWLDINPVFNYRILDQRLKPSKLRLITEGYAEGFTTDAGGNLYVVFNIRGYKWTKSPDNVLDTRAKLVIFKTDGPPTSL